jgi:hypothetical protein
MPYEKVVADPTAVYKVIFGGVPQICSKTANFRDLGSPGDPGWEDPASRILGPAAQILARRRGGMFFGQYPGAGLGPRSGSESGKSGDPWNPDPGPDLRGLGPGGHFPIFGEDSCEYRARFPGCLTPFLGELLETGQVDLAGSSGVGCLGFGEAAQLCRTPRKSAQTPRETRPKISKNAKNPKTAPFWHRTPPNLRFLFGHECGLGGRSAGLTPFPVFP